MAGAVAGWPRPQEDPRLRLGVQEFVHPEGLAHAQDQASGGPVPLPEPTFRR